MFKFWVGVVVSYEHQEETINKLEMVGDIKFVSSEIIQM